MENKTVEMVLKDLLLADNRKKKEEEGMVFCALLQYQQSSFLDVMRSMSDGVKW